MSVSLPCLCQQQPQHACMHACIATVCMISLSYSMGTNDIPMISVSCSMNIISNNECRPFMMVIDIITAMILMFYGIIATIIVL